MDDDAKVKSSGRLLFGLPWLLICLFLVGGFFALLNIHEEHFAYQVVAVICALVGWLAPFFMLGRAAVLLNSSWVYFGVVPFFLIPIGPLISWLVLIDKRAKLKQTLAPARA